MMALPDQTVIGPWRRDANGLLRWRETGYVVCRIEDGMIWFLDKSARDGNGKRQNVERAMTLDDLRQFVYGIDSVNT